jgi:hypothetical protein
MLLATMAAPARAGLVIYAQDTTVSSGGNGYLNIYLAGAPSDQFDTYQVTLSITPIGSAAGIVDFAPNGLAPDPANAASGEQPYNYLLPPGSAAPNYIFGNDSLASSLGINAGQQPSGSASSFFAILDLSLSRSEHAPSSDSPPTLATPGTLLASLLIQTVATSPGDQYSVNLVFNNSGGNGDTFFTNSGSDVAYQSTLGTAPGFSGTITIASVPEPAAIVSGMTALVLVAGFQLVRRSGRLRRKAA